MQRDARVKTGLTTVLSRGVDRAMLTYLGTLGILAIDDIDWSIVQRARHLHMGSYYMLDALRPAAPRLFTEAQARGLTVSLDTNYDPTEQWDGGIRATLAHVDIFLPNETEVKAIGRGATWQAALDTLAVRVPTVALKRGGDGADCAPRRGRSPRRGADCPSPSSTPPAPATRSTPALSTATWPAGRYNARSISPRRAARPPPAPPAASSPSRPWKKRLNCLPKTK